jgi:hypothetical protein
LDVFRPTGRRRERGCWLCWPWPCTSRFITRWFHSSRGRGPHPNGIGRPSSLPAPGRGQEWCVDAVGLFVVSRTKSGGFTNRTPSDGCLAIHHDSPEPSASQEDRWPDTDDRAWPVAAQLALQTVTGRNNAGENYRGTGRSNSTQFPRFRSSCNSRHTSRTRARVLAGSGTRCTLPSAKRARRRVSDHREVPCGAVARRTQRSGRPRAFSPAGRGLVRRAYNALPSSSFRRGPRA